MVGHCYRILCLPRNRRPDTWKWGPCYWSISSIKWVALTGNCRRSSDYRQWCPTTIRSIMITQLETLTKKSYWPLYLPNCHKNFCKFFWLTLEISGGSKLSFLVVAGCLLSQSENYTVQCTDPHPSGDKLTITVGFLTK